MSGFLVVGGSSFLVDAGLFQLLYVHVGVGAVIAKTTASLVSMTLAYLGHRYWSFSHRGRTTPVREYVVFLVVNALTLALTVVMVAIARYPLHQEDATVLQAVNLASIVLGTITRYLCYRQWVFPARTASEPATKQTAALPVQQAA
jgi:putative flippase GtrA